MQFEKNGTLANATHTNIKSIIGNSIFKSQTTACKVKEVTKDPAFSITFAEPHETHDKGNSAEYHTAPKAILFQYDLQHSHRNQLIFVHELQHAYLARRNHQAGIYYHANGDYSDSLLTPTQQEKNEFEQAIHHGLVRVTNAFKLLAKTQADLTPTEINSLKNLREATENYQPFRFERPAMQDNLDDLVQRGALDSNYKMIIRGMVNKEDASLTWINAFKFNLPIHYFQVSKEFGDYHWHYYTNDIRNKLAVALSDIVHVISTTTSKYPDEAVRNAELDAYLHQILQDYPALFNALFPKLLKFHQDRDTSEYKECLQQVPTSK